MRVTARRIVVPLLTVTLVLGVAGARAEDPPPDVDPARQGERYVIQPGAESLFGEMLGRGEMLPGGCALREGSIDRTAVHATYGCGDERVVVQLLHPSRASSGAVRTSRFAVAVESGAAPAGLVEAVAERVRAREAAFEWTEMAGDGAPARRRLVYGAGALAALLALWTLRRRAARRRRST